MGLAAVAAIWASVVYAPQQHSHHILKFLKDRHLLVIFTTFLLMVYSLQCYWQLRRSLKFWLFLFLFLGVFAVSATLWPFAGIPSFLWIALVGGLEFGIFALVTYRTFHAIPRSIR